MQVNLYSQTYGAVRFKHVAPGSLAKWLIPGIQPYLAEGPFGQILLQQITVGTAQFVYTTCRVKQDLALDFKIPGRLWLTHIALKNESRFDIASNPVCLKQGQYNMIRGSFPGTFYMEKGNDYETITISCDHKQLRELLLFFPNLNSLIRRPDPKTPGLMFRNHGRIDSRLTNTINRLLHCNYRGDLRRLLFDYKIKELLLLLLNRQNTGNNAPKELNDRASEVISEAKHFIKSGFNHPVTLYKIARQLGVNKMKLQNDFR